MARMLAALAYVVAFLSAPACAGLSKKNLVVNPSFELGSGAVNPDGWARWSDGATSGMYMWDNYAGRVFHGQRSVYAARIDNMSSRGGYISDAPIRVSPDREYVLMGFIATSQASGEARFSVRFVGKEGLLGEVFSPPVSGSTGPTSGDWVVSAVKVRPPEGTREAYVVCRADYLLGSAWFEDVGFRRITTSWLDSLGLPFAGGAVETAGTLRDAAIKAIVPKGKPGSPDGFRAEFEARAVKVAAAVESLRASGKSWEPPAALLGRARLYQSVGQRDLKAGWPRRGWGHLARSAELLAGAEDLARLGTGLPDPLPARGNPAFPLGVTLTVRQPVGATEWKSLMADVADFGFPDVGVDFPWAQWEPEEGKFDFSAVDNVMDAAEAHGISVFPSCGPKVANTPGRAPDGRTSLAGPPRWFMDRYPDSGLCNSSGECIKGCDGLFWEMAFLDPGTPQATGWLASWEAGLGALADRVKGRKALGGWMVGDRPRLGEGADPIRGITKPGLWGYNEGYREGFRSWLRQRYGTPAKLAAAWGPGAPASFDKAAPPGEAEIVPGESDPAKRYRGSSTRITDWLEYRSYALAQGLRRAAGLLSSRSGVPAVPRVLPFSANGPLDPDGLAPDLFGRGLGGPQAMEMITDAIPFPLLSRYQDATLSAAAASGAPVWLCDYSFRRGDMMGGEMRADLLAPPYVAPYVLGAVLDGARGFFFRGYTGKTGVASFAYPGRKGTGQVTLSDEGIAVAETVALLKAVSPWLATARPVGPRYGVVFSWPTVLFDDPKGDHLLAVLNALALGGMHDVALVPEEALGNGEAVPYEVLFAPHATRLSKGGAEALQAFVRRGGTLVADTYLASRDASGRFRGILPWGLDALFGVRPDPVNGKPSEDGLVGVQPRANFTEFPYVIPFSLSNFSGGYRVKAAAGTETLSVYLGGAAGKEVPAVTARRAGKGWAVIFPRVRNWPGILAEFAAIRMSYPELRGLQMGRQYYAYNGISCAIHLRRTLEHVGALPQARLARAPVSDRFLEEQAEWMKETGIPQAEVDHSRKLVRESQTGFPMLTRTELIFLARSGVDLDSFAPVRVGMLEGREGGRALVVINFSGMERVAEMVMPPCRAVQDIATGQPFPSSNGQLKLTLPPYQARLLAVIQ